jgi:hypothetical protein
MARSRLGIGLGALVLCLALAGCEDSCPTCAGSASQVIGFVVDHNGVGIVGETVHVLGKPPVQTGPNGIFVFDDVATPYDLVYEADRPITVWRGMTRRDPVIRGTTGVFAGLDSARVSGSAQLPSTGRTIVFFLAPEVLLSSSVVDFLTEQYSLRLGWLADGRSHWGRLFLLGFRQDPSTQRMLEYHGFASQSFEAQPGGVYRVDFPAVEDPLDRTIAGTVSVPNGYEAISAQLWMEAEGQKVPLEYQRLTGAGFDFVAPTLPGVTYRVGVDSRTDGVWFRRVFTARGGLQSWDRADITIRPAPEPLVPLQDQEVDRATAMSWRDDGAPALHIVHVYSSQTYVIHVVGTETRLDDLPGPGLVAGGSASWEIYRIDGQSVVDPSFRDSPRESFAVSEWVGFRVAAAPVGQP